MKLLCTALAESDQELYERIRESFQRAYQVAGKPKDCCLYVSSDSLGLLYKAYVTLATRDHCPTFFADFPIWVEIEEPDAPMTLSAGGGS